MPRSAEIAAVIQGEARFAEEAGALGFVVQVIGEQDVEILDAVSARDGSFGKDARHGTEIAREEFGGAAHRVRRKFSRRSGRLWCLALRFRSRLLVFLRGGESMAFQSLHQIVAARQERAAIRFT